MLIEWVEEATLFRKLDQFRWDEEKSEKKN
jgi:hypothetical protein